MMYLNSIICYNTLSLSKNVVRNKVPIYISVPSVPLCTYLRIVCISLVSAFDDQRFILNIFLFTVLQRSLSAFIVRFPFTDFKEIII